MDCKLMCRCGQVVEVSNFNLFRITFKCSRCGALNGIAEGLFNQYGERVGKVAKAELKDLMGMRENIKPEVAVRLLLHAETAIERAIAA